MSNKTKNETPLSTAQVRNLYSMAYAWRSEDGEGETDLSGLRESSGAEFDRWIHAHDAELRTLIEQWQGMYAVAAERSERATLILRNAASIWIRDVAVSGERSGDPGSILEEIWHELQKWDPAILREHDAKVRAEALEEAARAVPAHYVVGVDGNHHYASGRILALIAPVEESPAPEMFPGTLDALNALTIRPTERRN